MKKRITNHHLISSSILVLLMTAITGSIVLKANSSQAQVQAEETPSTAYGALYEVVHLQANVGSNDESVISYVNDGYFAYTSNENGIELWTAEDNLALNWSRATENPVAEKNCHQIGRHSLVTYQDEIYFATNFCGDGFAYIWKQTGLTTAELVHSVAIGDAGFPTAATVGATDEQRLVFFYDGGISVWDGTDWTEHTDIVGQPSGVPLEASTDDNDLYLAFSSGEVALLSFDENNEQWEYIRIGEDYLENVSADAAPGQHNLPAIAVFNNSVIVGNQDFENGASLFAYDRTSPTSTWEEIVQLEADDIIVNKMTPSQVFGKDRQYLIFYTANADVGTRVFGMNDQYDVWQLIDNGLGGGPDETEVVSIASRSVTDNGTTKQVLLFGTQNMTDQSRIYVLYLDEQMSVEPNEEGTILSAPTTNALSILAKKKNTTQYGETFRIKVSQNSIAKDDKLILYVDGKAVDQIKVKNVKTAVLSWKGAKKLEVGDTFTVSIGRRPAYGSGNDMQLSENVVEGSTMKVKVKK